VLRRCVDDCYGEVKSETFTNFYKRWTLGTFTAIGEYIHYEKGAGENRNRVDGNYITICKRHLS